MEKQISLNGQLKRYDLVVYRDLQPFLVIECKAPFVELTEEVAEQALRYNLILNAPYLMISNGVSDFVYHNKRRLEELPLYAEC